MDNIVILFCIDDYRYNSMTPVSTPLTPPPVLELVSAHGDSIFFGSNGHSVLSGQSLLMALFVVLSILASMFSTLVLTL